MKLSQGVLFVLTYILVQDVVSQEPAVGDIYLVPGDQGTPDIHKVQVYLPQSQGMQQQGQWGEICMKGIGDTLSIGTVICRQLGNTSGRLMVSPMQSKINDKTSRATTDVSIWLRGVDCGPPPPSVHHILRCKYNNVTTDGSGCTPAYIRCDDDKLTNHPYHGQAYLCPPLGFDVQSQSTSTGLVLLYLHNSWGTINYKKQVASGNNEMDTICRQLGFTRSNFQSGLPSYDYSHCYQSDDLSVPFVSGVWLTADEFDCGGSKACSGCCYGYPPATSRVVPTRQADLQLSCTFDPETQGQYTEGNSFLCSFNDTKDFAQLKSSACAVKDESSKSIIIVGSVLGAATLISLLLALTGCIGYVRVKRRLHGHGEEQPLLQRQQAQPQRQQLQNLQNNDDAGN